MQCGILELKKKLLEGSVTAYPDFEREFAVKPDASKSTVEVASQ